MSKCAGCGKPLGLNEKICQGCGIRTPESNLGGEIHPSLKFVPPNPVNIPKAPVFHKKVEERKAVVIERLPPVKDNGLSFGKILALFVALAAVLAIAYFWFWLPKQTQDQATLNVPPVPPLAQAQIKSTNEVTQDPGVNSVDIRQEATNQTQNQATLDVAPTQLSTQAQIKLSNEAIPRELGLVNSVDIRQETYKLKQPRDADARAVTAMENEVAAYKAKIRAKILRNIVMSSDIPKDALAEFDVTLFSGGVVLNVKLVKSSGSAMYDRAVERAIKKSDPLPVPPEGLLSNQFRELRLNFSPNE